MYEEGEKHGSDQEIFDRWAQVKHVYLFVFGRQFLVIETVNDTN